MIDRLSIRNYRKQLSPEFVAQGSDVVSQKIIRLPAFLNGEHIAYYHAHENEVDPVVVFDCARELKKSLYCPVFSQKNGLDFYLINEKTEFKENKFGIKEPVVSACPVDPTTIDLFLMPLVAFDQRCHRVGRGSGCYDRALHFMLESPIKNHPILIGLAYEFQKVDDIIPSAWDVSMDCVVTEKAVYLKNPSEARTK